MVETLKLGALPLLALVALEVTRPLVFLQRGRRESLGLLPRPHWGFSLGYWVSASASFVLIATACSVSTTEALIAVLVASLYNLLSYHSGAEVTGTWASARFRALGWPHPRRRLRYELPALVAERDPELTRVWRKTVARYEPNRLFSEHPPRLVNDGDDSKSPTVYYGNAGWLWAAFSKKQEVPQMHVGIRSRLPFALPLLREAALLGGCILVPWDWDAVHYVYLDVDAIGALATVCPIRFVPIATHRGHMVVGPTHRDVDTAFQRWQDLHDPLLECKWGQGQ